MRKAGYLLFMVLMIAGLSSCGKNRRFRINTEKESVNTDIHRFDSDFLKVDTTNIKVSVRNLYAKYPKFMPVYVSDILGSKPNDTVAVENQIKHFLADTTFTKVDQDVSSKFTNMDSIYNALNEAYTYIHHYFPGLKLPPIYFYVSGFNQSIIINSGCIGIGLDMYLGSDYPKYKEMSYDYMKSNMRSQMIPVDIVSAFLFKSFPAHLQKEDLLNNMLYRGKVMFLLSVMMPGEKINNLMGYSKREWEWCRKYEKDIWDTMMDQKDIYSSNMLLIRKYLNDAPFTTPISQESPGRLGTWVGWQIIQSYMDHHKDVTLQELMSDNNYQQIFVNSQYKP